MAEHKKDDISRRQFARYACRLSVRVILLQEQKKSDAEIHDISLGGAHLFTQGPLNSDTIMLEFGKEHGGFYVEADCVRKGGKDPNTARTYLYGIRFRVAQGSKSEAKLRQLIDRVRATLEPGTQLKRDYWSI